MAEHLHLWLEDCWNDQVALRLRVRSCLEDVHSAFQHIAVYDSFALGKILTLGGSIVLSESDEAAYSETLCHSALQCHPDARTVLVLGGGDGGVCREAARYPQLQQITVVEIDEHLVEIAKRHFPKAACGLKDPRVVLRLDDAHRYLTSVEEHHDIILIDADHLLENASDSVHRRPFGNLLRDRLHEDGVLIAPLGIPSFMGEHARRLLQQLRERFAIVRVFQMSAGTGLGQERAVAWCSQKREPELSDRVERGFLPDLDYWARERFTAAFALPRHMRERLD